MERPTRATRAVLATSTEEFASAARPIIANAASGGTPASLVSVKIDAAGRWADNGQTAALREQVVELIRRNLRASDVVAHATLEDVIVLLQGAAGRQGQHVAGRLCSAIRNHHGSFSTCDSVRSKPTNM